METTYKFRKNTKDNNLLAFCEVSVLGQFILAGIKIWKNEDGISAQLPGSSNVAKNGQKYFNKYFRYVNHDHTVKLQNSITEAYLQWAETETVQVKQQDLLEPTD